MCVSAVYALVVGTGTVPVFYGRYTGTGTGTLHCGTKYMSSARECVLVPYGVCRLANYGNLLLCINYL